ncbi:Organic hydroperoxide reductase OsmC/OhrA [Micromonospora nigra]|uniref:Organic hydroperoxide reductase OsmC/OhrA n=1 Tax=Micromonospora nigra TaxID=145857 RepID=A0A1C6T3T8_9ACTN|nr:OsmC family protein [Micromonospora nigra]SCL36401.1 Organic hydroperoxide reductase OsmC/OhrA [Micromonospora nigra]
MTHHHYSTTVTWTGNLGTGTSGYRDYRRDHHVTTDGRPPIPGSSDPTFRGDPTRWNPEQLLLASLSQCHMLWYLHLCADHHIVVTDYVDHATATMTTDDTGTGRFTDALLRPHVTVADPTTVETATALHTAAHHACYIANSVTFPVRHEPTVTAT